MAEYQYYFTISDGDKTSIDPGGRQLAALLAEREAARRQGRPPGDALRVTVTVTDSFGATVLKAPLEVSGGAPPHLDALTGLLTRGEFLKRIDQAIQVGGPEDLTALLLLDVDRLKDINDALGYATGNAVLEHVAQILKKHAAPTASPVARFEGDKFAIALRRGPALLQAERFAEAIQTELRQPFSFGDIMISHPASAGLAFAIKDAQSALDLVGNADIALHHSKTAGALVVYSDKMRADQKQHFAALAEARSALAERRIVPHYQPKISIRTGAIQGFEALLRLNHATLGIRPPAAIADALDHRELAVPIGKEMQRCVFDDIQSWMGQGTDFGQIALNASPVELLLSAYADDFLNGLERRNIPAERVQLEITETSMTGNGSEHIIGELKKLTARGVAVFFDDFGTGYESLVHLREFPIGGLKIDRSFVKDLGHNAQARAITTAIIQLAQNLGLLLVAEGIENQDQEDFLFEAGCEVVQGYLYAKAMPASALGSFLSEWRQSTAAARARQRLLPVW